MLTLKAKLKQNLEKNKPYILYHKKAYVLKKQRKANRTYQKGRVSFSKYSFVADTTLVL